MFQKTSPTRTIGERLGGECMCPQNSAKEAKEKVGPTTGWLERRVANPGGQCVVVLEELEITLALPLFSKACWKSVKPFSSGSISVANVFSFFCPWSKLFIQVLI